MSACVQAGGQTCAAVPDHCCCCAWPAPQSNSCPSEPWPRFMTGVALGVAAWEPPSLPFGAAPWAAWACCWAAWAAWACCSCCSCAARRGHQTLCRSAYVARKPERRHGPLAGYSSGSDRQNHGMGRMNDNSRRGVSPDSVVAAAAAGAAAVAAAADSQPLPEQPAEHAHCGDAAAPGDDPQTGHAHQRLRSHPGCQS